MKRILVVILGFVLNDTAAQTESASARLAASVLEESYNQGDYESIFDAFAPNMKEFLPLDKAIAFLTSLKRDAGEIKEREFIRYRSGYASYKTIFERGIYLLEISIDGETKINGLLVKPFEAGSLPVMERNVTVYILPVEGTWEVVWGGDTREQNYHVENRAQKNAFDLAIVGSDGKRYRSDGLTNEDYYAFNQEIVAPCDGEVVLVVDGIKDNKPGEMNPVYIPGNTVIIKSANDEYLFFAHFKQHSIRVKEGDRVKQGQLLGHCGNSGNSSEPHVHFHIQNVEDINIATGVKCYFEEIVVNGVVRRDYSPVRGEMIGSK